jgi:hypothetical protein
MMMGPGTVAAGSVTMAQLANALSQRVGRTVVDKTGMPPSGDRHDYYSIPRYFWPNPDKPDGLPWVRRDGQVNPDTTTGQYDKTASDAMFRAVLNLGLAYFYLGDEDNAARAAEYVRAWFITPETRMNPNLAYAEGVPGRSDGRSEGLIEFSKVSDLFDGIALISGSKAWTEADAAGLKDWMTSYYGWLTTHPNAAAESNARNNHGTYFDVQRVAIAIYLGKIDEARAVLETAKTKRIGAQITPEGVQPEEVARASSWFYSTFNLVALMDLATLAQRVGVDLWHYESSDGRSIRKALDFLAPFVFYGQRWPHAGSL